MALSAEKKAQITAETEAYLAANETAVLNVATMAWAYSCSSQEITPLFRSWVKQGLIAVAYTSCVGNRCYRSARGPLASILAQGDKGIALDYLQDKGLSRADADVKIRVMMGWH
jgi:hypothetical protein